MEYLELVAVLAHEGRLAIEAVRDLPDADFARPTRCPLWDVKALIAHLWRDVDRIGAYLSDEPTSGPEGDAVTYWRAYDPVAEGPLISAHTLEIADRFATGSELVASFASHLGDQMHSAHAQRPERLINTRLQTMRLDEFVETRVLELTVHGLDLARALDRAPWTTPGGAEVTGRILVALLGAPPPPGLGWSDVVFIETGTGRRALTEPERSALGAKADRFPLLG